MSDLYYAEKQRNFSMIGYLKVVIREFDFVLFVFLSRDRAVRSTRARFFFFSPPAADV